LHWHMANLLVLSAGKEILYPTIFEDWLRSIEGYYGSMNERWRVFFGKFLQTILDRDVLPPPELARRIPKMMSWFKPEYVQVPNADPDKLAKLLACFQFEAARKKLIW
jgi:hypothetical protein